MPSFLLCSEDHEDGDDVDGEDKEEDDEDEDGVEEDREDKDKRGRGASTSKEKEELRHGFSCSLFCSFKIRADFRHSH